MPHSSGGGSHGGGSHGGSHGGRSHGSSGTGAPARRRSTVFFPGARTFLLSKNGKNKYYYADYDMTKPASAGDIMSSLMVVFFALIFSLSGFAAASDAINIPKKLSLDYNTTVIIEDYAGVINDKSGLESTLTEFRDKTGVTPAVITVKNSTWQENYNNLESYAYDLYVNRFSDEKHWLIVYSEPVISDLTFKDWYWEGMQGNDTDRIITQKTAQSFNEKLQEGLLKNSSSVGLAIRTAFITILPDIMDVQFEWSALIPIIMFCIFPFGIAGLIIYKTVQQRKDCKYITEIKPEPIKKAPVKKQGTCEYCDGTYIIGQGVTCPHCGAPLPPVNN